MIPTINWWSWGQEEPIPPVISDLANSSLPAGGCGGNALIPH